MPGLEYSMTLQNSSKSSHNKGMSSNESSWSQRFGCRYKIIPPFPLINYFYGWDFNKFTAVYIDLLKGDTNTLM